MRVNSPTHAHTATHGGVEGHAHAHSAAQASGSFNGHPVSMARPDGASGSRSLGKAAKVVKRLAQRLMPGARPAQREPQRAEAAPLHIPRDYGWPLGLMDRKNLAAMHPDDAYEEAFATHEARVSAQVEESALHRFGHTHVDDETLKEQLQAWFNGADGAHDDADVKNIDDSPVASSRHSARDASPSASSGTHSRESMSPRFDDSPATTVGTHSRTHSDAASVHSNASHESEIQEVHDDGAARTMPAHEASTSGTRKVRFAPEVSVRTFAEEKSSPDGNASPVKAGASPSHAQASYVDDKAPLHSRDRESVKPKGHKPDDPGYRELARQRSINQAAWETVTNMKSPRISADVRKTTTGMFKQNQIRFDIKNQYRVAAEDEPHVLALATALDKATGPAPSRSFAGKVKNLVRSLVPQRSSAPEAGLIRVLGPDLRHDPSELNGEHA